MTLRNVLLHSSMPKEYLGDGAFIEFDGYALVLTTEDGYSTTNRIVLEPQVYDALTQFVARLKGK